MKPLGKTMKIAHKNDTSEKEALEQILQNYRDTQHPVPAATKATILIPGGQRFLCPRQTITDKQIAKARETDYSKKHYGIRVSN